MLRQDFNKIKKNMKKPIGSPYGSYSNINKSVETLKTSILRRISISKKKSKANKKNLDYGNSASHITKSSEDFYNQVSYNVLENATKDTTYQPLHQDHKAIISSKEVLGNENSLSGIFGSKSGYGSKNLGKTKSKMAIPILIGAIVFFILGCIVYTNFFGQVYDTKSAVKIVCNEIASVDRNLVALNEVLGSEITVATYDSAQNIKKSLESDTDNLSSLEERLQEIISEAEAGSDDGAYAPLASDAISNRKIMIDTGVQIMDLAVSAACDIDKFDTF